MQIGLLRGVQADAEDNRLRGRDAGPYCEEPPYPQILLKGMLITPGHPA